MPQPSFGITGDAIIRQPPPFAYFRKVWAIVAKDIAAELAKEIGLGELTDRHWAVIAFSRADFKANGAAPTLRRITKESGVPTKELYKLFPKGPAKKVALVSGLSKPTGCI